jgi:hypothetical protein
MHSFAILAKMLDDAKQEVLSLYDKRRDYLQHPTLGLPVKKEEVREYLRTRVIIIPSGKFTDIEPGERVPIFLNDGHIAKVSVDGVIMGLDKVFYTLQPENILHHKFEEENVKVLRESGFTKEHDFIVPEHKVFGVVLDGEKVRVVPDGDGWVLADDMSVGGYVVRDIEPHHFSSLAFRDKFLHDYRKHMDKLTTFHVTQHVDITVQRHGRPEDYSQALSRTLLVRIKNNIGEIIIGDLDNLEFVRKD